MSNFSNNSLFKGKSGEGWILLKLFETLKQQSLLDQALELGRQCCNDVRQNTTMVGKSSLADGVSGVLLFLIYLSRYCREEWLQTGIIQNVRLLVNNAGINDYGLYWHGISDSPDRALGYRYGNSGIAMVLSELAIVTGNTCFDELATLALKYEQYYANGSEVNIPLNIGYEAIGKLPVLQLPASIFDYAGLNKQFLKKNFPGTIKLMEIYFPDEMLAFYKSDHIRLPGEFRTLIKEIEHRGVQQKLNLVFRQECFLLDLHQSLVQYQYKPEDEAIERIEQVLLLPVNDFSNVFLTLADDIWIFDPEPDIDYTQTITSSVIQFLFTEYGTNSFFYKVNRFKKIDKHPLGILKAVCHFFGKGSTIGVAAKAMLQFLSTHKKEFHLLYREILQDQPGDNVEQQMHYAVLRAIRASLILGLLQVDTSACVS